jgi:hypothetical protein
LGHRKSGHTFVLRQFHHVLSRSLLSDHTQLNRYRIKLSINAIAHGDNNKVSEIASLKAKGRTWTELAISNGITIAAVAQTTRNADQLTVTAYSNAAERAHGGADKLKSIGVKIQPNARPGN